MLSVRQLSASAALLITVGITAASSNALSPTQIESRPSQPIAHNQQAQDSQIPDLVKHQYREDATELALRLLVQEGATSEDSVELPADLIQFEVIVKYCHSSAKLINSTSIQSVKYR